MNAPPQSEPEPDSPRRNIFLPSPVSNGIPQTVPRIAETSRADHNSRLPPPTGNAASNADKGQSHPPLPLGNKDAKTASSPLYDFSRVYLADYQYPRWWTPLWEWTAFISRKPVFSGIFSGIAQSPKPQRHGNGFKLPEKTISRLSSLEGDIRHATFLLAHHLTISLVYPVLPWVFGYKERHPTASAALESFVRSRDWCVIWMGLLSYLIARCRIREDAFSEYPSPANTSWLTYLMQHGCRPTWIDELNSSTLCSFTPANPRAGLFLNLPVTPPHISVEWLCFFGIPVWYPWEAEQRQNPNLAAYAPLDHQLQSIMEPLVLQPSALDLPCSGGLPDNARSTASPHNDTLSVQHTRSAPLNDTESIPMTWQEFFAVREQHNKDILALETAGDRQRRLSRESKPPTRKAKIFEWQKDHRGILIREAVLGKYKIETLAAYAKDQIRYDAFRNEYDCCTEFGPGDGFIEDEYDDDGYSDYDEVYNYQVPDHQIQVDHAPDPTVHTSSEIRQDPETPAPHDYDDDSEWVLGDHEAKKIREGSLADTFEAEVLETVRLWYGYIPTSPSTHSKELRSEGEQKAFMKTLGFTWRTDILDAFSRPSISAVSAFLQRLASNQPISRYDWDLGDGHIQSVVLQSRFSHIRRLRTGSSTLYMFDFGHETSQEKWKLTMTSAAHALMVCRLDPRFNVRDITRYLLNHGIPFRTLQLSSTLQRAPVRSASLAKYPVRLPGHVFTTEDYRSYRDRCSDMLKRPRARIALMMGGHMWRIAAPIVSFDSVISGPTGWSTNLDEMLVATSESGEEYIDDKLTDYEAEILSGLNICLTGMYLYSVSLFIFHLVQYRAWYADCQTIVVSPSKDT